MTKCTDNLTLGEIKELMSLFNKPHAEQKEFMQVGGCYFIRTVTLHYVGRIKDISDREILLEDAAWIPDTGRFYNCLKNGEFSEVEPFLNPICISRGAIVDYTAWSHKLPRDHI